MIKRQWYWNLREIRVFFYEWVERCETGKAWDLLCKKKKKRKEMFFEKYTLLFDTSFWLFGFSIFISSYQVKLGRLDLVWIDCRKFCALFFVCWLRSFFSFPSLLCANLFFPTNFWIFFFSPKISHFGICLLGFLRTFWPSLFCYCCSFPSFIFEAFCSKFSFIKGEPAQFRFHSSEFSVSIMHSSLLS